MKAKIFVTLKKGVLDPQGTTVQRSLHQMGYSSVSSVRIGKYLELDVDAADQQAAHAMVDEMCRKMFANPNIEQYSFALSR